MKEMGLVSSCHSGCIKLSAKALIYFLADHLLGLAQSTVLELKSLLMLHKIQDVLGKGETLSSTSLY